MPAAVTATSVKVFDLGAGVDADVQVTIAPPGANVPFVYKMNINELGLTQMQKDNLQNAMNAVKNRALAQTRLDFDIP